MTSGALHHRQQYQQARDAPLVLGTYKEEAPKIGAYFAEEIRQHSENSPTFGVRASTSAG